MFHYSVILDLFYTDQDKFLESLLNRLVSKLPSERHHDHDDHAYDENSSEENDHEAHDDHHAVGCAILYKAL